MSKLENIDAVLNFTFKAGQHRVIVGKSGEVYLEKMFKDNLGDPCWITADSEQILTFVLARLAVLLKVDSSYIELDLGPLA